MDARIRRRIRDRAHNRYEYCRVPQSAIKAVLHVEHIVAKQHEGGNVEDNLALACDRCNFYKGTNLSGVDPDSGQVVRLFNPRTDAWADHFTLVAAEVVGSTPTGRATARLLQFNSENRLRLRETLITTGQW